MAHHCLVCGERIPSSDWHMECSQCRTLTEEQKATVKMLKEERRAEDNTAGTDKTE